MWEDYHCLHFCSDHMSAWYQMIPILSQYVLSTSRVVEEEVKFNLKHKKPIVNVVRTDFEVVKIVWCAYLGNPPCVQRHSDLEMKHQCNSLSRLKNNNK